MSSDLLATLDPASPVRASVSRPNSTRTNASTPTTRRSRTLVAWICPRGIYTHDARTDEIAYPDIQTEADERSPAFSPDGSVLAYASDASGRDEIMLWPVAGGPATSIGAAPCAPTRLWWLPEGEGLLVGCDTEFAVIDRQGRAVLPAQPGTPRDLAPDGRRVLLELTVDAELHVAVFDLGDRSTVDLGPGRAPVWRPMR